MLILTTGHVPFKALPGADETAAGDDKDYLQVIIAEDERKG